MEKEDKIPGGLTDKWSVKDVANKHNVSVSKIEKELEAGATVELEHTKDKTKAREIALDHLHEFPDYYTRLKDMENKAEKEINEGGITAYAKRMRELAGYSEDENKKSLKTIQEGISAFDKGMTFYAKDMMAPKKKSDKLPGDLDINGNPIPAPVNESEEKEEEFETHTFEQKTIEEGTEDEELYTLNENTIIVLDFLTENEENEKYIDPVEKAHDEYEKEKNERKYGSDEWVKAQQDLEESSTSEVRHDSDRKGPSDSATWHDEGKEMKGNDGEMWKIVTGSNNVNRWVHV